MSNLPESLIDIARRNDLEIRDGRTIKDSLDYMDGERKELLDEINGAGGPDGIFGEAIDVMLCALDIALKARPGVSNEEIVAYALVKSEKWQRKWQETLASADATGDSSKP